MTEQAVVASTHEAAGEPGAETTVTEWRLFTDTTESCEPPATWPAPPPWRKFDGKVIKERAFGPMPASRGGPFQSTPEVREMVNAALFLRRPLLLTGRPGSGKSSLIEAVAWQLQLGPVLTWSITSRTTLQQGLYQYDAVGRLYEQRRIRSAPDIGQFIELGPLGTALLPTARPRALLIDEIDKSDIDFPNDLLNVFERGFFHIPELSRLETQEPVLVRQFGGGAGADDKFPIVNGQVGCLEFPFVVLTSNGERDFPAPFLRRCLRYTMPTPDFSLLQRIVRAHLGDEATQRADDMIRKFETTSKDQAVATDQLLNAVFLVTRGTPMGTDERQRVLDIVLKELADAPEPR